MIEQKDLPEIITNGNITLTIGDRNDSTTTYRADVSGVKKDDINLSGTYAILLNVKTQKEDYLYHYDEGDKRHKMDRQIYDFEDIGRALNKNEMLLRKISYIDISDFSHVTPRRNKKEEQTEKVEIPIKRYSNKEFLSKLGEI